MSNYDILMYDVWGDPDSEDGVWVNDLYFITTVEADEDWLRDASDKELATFIIESAILVGRAFEGYEVEEIEQLLEVQENGSDPEFAIYFELKGIPACEMRKVRE